MLGSLPGTPLRSSVAAVLLIVALLPVPACKRAPEGHFRTADGQFALTEDAFRERCKALLAERIPGVRLEDRDGFRVDVILGDGEGNEEVSELYLGNIYREYLADPSRFDAVVGPFLDAIVAAIDQPDPRELPFEQAGAYVYPALESEDYLAALDREMEDEAGHSVSFGLVGTLRYALVLPVGDSYSYVVEGDLERWDVGRAVIQARALQNLDDVAREAPLRLGDDGQLLLDDSPVFPSSLILVQSFQERMAAALGEEPVVAVPARDTCVLVPASNLAALQERAPALAALYGTAPHPLSRELYRLRPTGLEVVGTF